MARLSDGREASAAVARERPDVAVVDLLMPSMSAIELAREAGSTSPGTAVVVFTEHEDAHLLREALDAGVRGWVQKDAPLADLVRAVQAVGEGGHYLQGRLTGGLSPPNGSILSDRERTVLTMLAEGLRTEEIGERLYLSPDTVKAHIGKAMRKLGAKNRTQAVAEALRRDLLG